MIIPIKNIPLKFINILSGLCLVLGVGTIGYWYIGSGKYSVIDSLYMTVITITTIGFSEVVDLTESPAGRIFTMFIAITGIATLSYLLTTLTAYIVEGEIRNSFGRRRMEKRAASFTGHHIICGMGNVGQYILSEMKETGYSFCAVDINPEKEELIDSSLRNNAFIVGDAMENDTLLKAGIEKASGVFVSTGDDHWNLIVSLTARQLNPKIKIVSECVNLRNREKIIQAGANNVVSTSKISGLRMASEMVRPTVVSFLDNMLRDTQKGLRIEEIEIKSRGGSSIGSLQLNEHRDFLILAVDGKDGIKFNPHPETVLSNGERLIVMTTAESRKTMHDLLA